MTIDSGINTQRILLQNEGAIPSTNESSSKTKVRTQDANTFRSAPRHPRPSRQKRRFEPKTPTRSPQPQAPTTLSSKTKVRTQDANTFRLIPKPNDPLVKNEGSNPRRQHVPLSPKHRRPSRQKRRFEPKTPTRSAPPKHRRPSRQKRRFEPKTP